MTVELALYKEHAVRLTNGNMFTCDGFDAFPSYAELCAAIDKSLRVTFKPVRVIYARLGSPLGEYESSRLHRAEPSYGGGTQCWVKDADGRRSTVSGCYADTAENRVLFAEASEKYAEAERLSKECDALIKQMTPPVFEVKA